MPVVTKCAVPLLAVIVLASCGGNASPPAGGGNDESAVRAVIADLQAASRAGDGNRICNQIFTPKLADSVTSESRSKSCAKEVREKLFSPHARITAESVNVSDPTSALAIVKEQNGKTSRMDLVKQSGRWRVRGVQPAQS